MCSACATASLYHPIPTFGPTCARVISISFGCAFAQLLQTAQFPACEINTDGTKALSHTQNTTSFWETLFCREFEIGSFMH